MFFIHRARVAALREHLADRLTRGHLTRLRVDNQRLRDTVRDQQAQLAATPCNQQARTLAGAILARPEVRAVVPAPVFTYWRAQHQRLSRQATT